MLLYLSIAAVLMSGAISFFFFRRAKMLSDILMNGARQFEEQRQELSLAKSRISALEAANMTFEKDLQMSKAIHEAEAARHAHIVSDCLNVQTTLERKLANAELQRDHILNRFEALQDEREHFETDHSSLNQKIQATEAEKERLLAELSELKKTGTPKLRAENEELRRRIQLLEKEMADIKSRKEIDPKEFDSIRRRAAHNDQLYHSMKSLRDMAEERNRNWEQALKSLATWILSSSSVARPNDPILSQPIGPLVGEALERIGGSLVGFDDAAELMAEQQVMTSAEH